LIISRTVFFSYSLSQPGVRKIDDLILGEGWGEGKLPSPLTPAPLPEVKINYSPTGGSKRLG
jgi:hypothetical protein